MRDKIEISTQLLRADVAEMSLWWKRGEQEIGMLESVLEEIPKMWSGTAEHLWYGNIDSYYQNCKADGSGWGVFWSLCGDVVRRMSAASGN